jgi:hypothetical protein
MTSRMEHRSWVSGRGLPAVRGALALAIVLVPAVAVTRPAQAQTYTVLHTFTGPDAISRRGFASGRGGQPLRHRLLRWHFRPRSGV